MKRMVVALILSAGSAHGAVIFYDNEIDFLNAISIAGVELSLEDFEPPPISPISSTELLFPDVTLRGIGGAVTHSEVLGPITTAGDGWAFYETPTVLEVVFAEPIYAFAVDFYDVLERADATLTIESLPGESFFDVLVAETGDVGLPGSNFVFAGIVSDTPFTGLRLVQTAPVLEDVIFIDDIQFGAVVPIPTAFWLFGSALGLLGWVRRRKQ